MDLTLEGKQREYFFEDSVWKEVLLYSTLRSEWEAMRANRLPTVDARNLEKPGGSIADRQLETVAAERTIGHEAPVAIPACRRGCLRDCPIGRRKSDSPQGGSLGGIFLPVGGQVESNSMGEKLVVSNTLGGHVSWFSGQPVAAVSVKFWPRWGIASRF